MSLLITIPCTFQKKRPYKTSVSVFCLFFTERRRRQAKSTDILHFRLMQNNVFLLKHTFCAPASSYSPVRKARLVQSHEVNLAAAAALGRAKEHFVVPLAEELQLLSLLMHEHSVQMSSLYGSNLDGLVAPAHDLSRADVGHGGRQLSPLQDDVLTDLAVGVYVHALVVVAQEQLHAVRVGEGDDGVRSDWSLSVFGQVDVVHGG